MSDRMRPVPFDVLLGWIQQEFAMTVATFGVKHRFRSSPKHTLSLFGETMEVPAGPAAGPHTQLAQNIIAAYIGGARFFELKTVQTLDGPDLPVSKPCILAGDEGYNVEWSTELTVSEALDEYVKAWFAVKLLAKEFGLGGGDGFLFNMSVGYDLEGIRSPKIDGFLEGLKDASALPVWETCRMTARDFLPCFNNVDDTYLESISPIVSRSVTLSTLHGCPAEEIERIAAYLITEKGLHTFVKCNPTLLGYAFVRDTLDAMGYHDLAFDDHHFKTDLQFEDAVPMLARLKTLAESRGLTFGVKLTNTLPVDITAHELPGGEMYLSGKALAPLTLALAERLSRAFAGQLRISYSGGADAFNIGEIFRCGVWPITAATTLLKPGGYRRLGQMAERLSAMEYKPFDGVDTEGLAALAEAVRSDPRYGKGIKPPPPRKLAEKVPLLDCFTAPCKSGCPFGQDVPEYLCLLGEERPDEALRVILDKNPLPNITGTICSHRCTDRCMRGYYESPIRIREAKLAAVRGGWDAVLPELVPDIRFCSGLRVAVVGGGPAGMSAAFLLARRGVSVTLFEKTGALGGVVRHVIPEFRIGADAIDADGALLQRLGVEIRLSTEAPDAAGLQEQGFSHVILAVGATVPLPLEAEGGKPLPAVEFLRAVKADPASVSGKTHIVVVGGGNVAMDAARAAKRLNGVGDVTVVYRRTRRYMPADAGELALALEEGVKLLELLSPVSWDSAAGELICRRLVLGGTDDSGRRVPLETAGTAALPCDLLLSAVGEGADAAFLIRNGVTMGPDGRPVVQAATLESAAEGVYVAGDARRGPATVAEAIADAHRIADAIAGRPAARPLSAGRRGEAMSKKGILKEPGDPAQECDRCLECSTVCECCVDVCPNRANVAVNVLTRRMPQIVHIDGMCNACGNCATFCPYDSAPYREKFTVFGSPEDFEAGEAPGFVLLDKASRTVRVRLPDGRILDTPLCGENGCLPEEIRELIETVCSDYPYLLY